MTTITLSLHQVASIVEPRVIELCDRHDKEMARAVKAYDALQRRSNRRVDAANARAAEWKQHYGEARKQLLEARAEIVELKRRLREER